MTTTAQRHHDDIPVPRGVLFAAGALLVASIGLAAFARHERLAEEAAAPAAPRAIASAMLRFEDREGGAIAVLDAATGREVTTVAPATNGFVRGVLRGMFRTRKLESMDRKATFRLAREATGRLVLDDLESGRHVDLDSFGPTNAEAFASILAAATTR